MGFDSTPVWHEEVAQMSTRVALVSDRAFMGHVTVSNGLARGLEEIGLDVHHHVIDPQAELADLRAALQPGGVAVQCLIPPLLTPVPRQKNIALVYHEWSRMPVAWVDRLNSFDRIWVTSRYNADVLRHSGYHGPLDQLPALLAVDDFSQKKEWQAGEAFRFLSVGEWHFRKGYHLLAAAFSKAFPDNEPVELHIKTTAGTEHDFGDQRIRLLSERLDGAAMRELYSGYDAYVTTSLAEGLGLPVGEAMASGLPVAAVNWGGLMEFTGDGRSLDIPFHLADQPYCSRPDYYAPGQQCALAEIDGAAAILSAMYRMSASGRELLARAAHAHIQRNHSLERVLDSLNRAVESL